ncbi:MAG: phage head spike fiber domain-containing protein [Cypionkella sp.]
MRVFPDTLPLSSWPSYVLTPVDQTLRTDMEVGEERVRRLTFARRDTVDVEWRMKDVEFNAFRAWFGDEAWSLSGDCDDLTTWGTTNATITANAVAGPDNQLAELITETTAASAAHLANKFLATVPQNATVVFRVTLKAAGRGFARVTMFDWSGAMSYTFVNLATGALLGQFGLISRAVKDRLNGWWRIEIVAPTGAGSSTPFFRVNLSTDGTITSYTGDGISGVYACEQQVKIYTGYDLFLPTDSTGAATGASGGSAWFTIALPFGGGMVLKQVRFIGTFAASPLQGLNWSIRAKLKVR